MRPLTFVFAAFCCLAALFCLRLPLLAQTSPTQGYAGYTLHLSGTSGSTRSGFTQTGDWRVYGPNSGSAIAASSSTAMNGWTLSQQGATSTVGISASAAPGTYTAEYCTRVTDVYNAKTDTDIITYYFYAAGFTVVATPPTLPPAGMPAFSWQGSAAGVNTGNGNKTTTLPITGWTMRGGMPVSCTLYHNSQGSVGGTYGYKWTPSYLSYFSNLGSSPTIHWDNGLSYTFTLNPDGSSFTAPIGILDKLTIGNNAYLLTTPNQTVYKFGYSSSGNAYLTSITDKDGNALTINHNSDTTLSTVVDSTGRALTYTYSGGHLTAVTDPLGRQWGFVYVSGSYLQTVTLPPVNGQNPSVNFWYGDGRQNITASTDARGNSSFYTYNSSNSLATAKDPLGNQTTFTYNADNTVITDPNGHTTTHTYAYSQLSKVTDALGYSSFSNYDVDNILSSTKDKRGNIGYFSSHFSNGTSTSTSMDPLNHSSSSTYDAKNEVIGSVDALGNATANTYSTDGKEDLLTTSVTGTGSAPFKATSKIGGYSYGLPTTFTDALGFSSSVGYDGNGYPNSATDANSHISSAVFNALGWKTSSTDANNHTTTSTYDNWGRVTAVTAPDNTQTTMTYDPNGNVLTVTDADHHTVTNVYDADNRLIQTTNGRGDVVRYTYDGPNGYGSPDTNGNTQKGLLSSKTDGNGHTTTYTYTARNEPYQSFYADGTSEGVAYDQNGNVTVRSNGKYQFFHYAYDADNRLTDITYPVMPAVHFDYDANGRKTHMHDSTGDTYWTYGDGVHLTQQQTPQGTVGYAYDGDGRRTAMSLLGTYPYWTYGYDPAGRLLTLRSPLDGTTTYAYDAADRTTKKTEGNGNYELYAYDTADQLTSIGY